MPTVNSVAFLLLFGVETASIIYVFEAFWMSVGHLFSP